MLAYMLSGLVVGCLVGMTGVGGGSLMTPLLVLGFGVSPVTAVGTDLLYAALTKSAGVWFHARRGTVEWRIVGLMAAGSIPAALATIGVLRQFAAKPVHLSASITFSLGIALVLTALSLIFRDKLRRLRLARQAPETVARPARGSAAATVFIGALLGALVALSSVGAGALGVVALVFLYPALPLLRVVGTDIAHAVPLTLVAGLGYAHLGVVDYGLLGSLLLGSLPGIWIGSHLSLRIPERALRNVMAGVLTLVGLKLII